MKKVPGRLCRIARRNRPAACRHHQQRGDRAGACGLTEHRDVARVAAERGDVVVHPAQCGDLIEQAAVVRRAVEPGEALGAGAVVGADHDRAGRRGTVAPARCGLAVSQFR